MQHIHNPRALSQGIEPLIRADANEPRELFGRLRAAIDHQFGQQNERVENIEAALNAVIGGQLPAGISAFGLFGNGGPSWGDQVVNSAQLTEFRDAAGKARVQIALKPNAAITSVTP